MRILFTGSGEFGLPTLAALLAAQHEIAAVYTQPDRPAGRGRKLAPTPIAQFALEHGLPLIRTPDLNSESLPPADLMIVIAFGQKISPEAAIHPRLGSVNLHASLLPRFRGAAPINWAILRGEIQTGNSVIRLAQKMDAGNILGQSTTPIGELETAGELHDRLAAGGADLMLQTMKDLQAARVAEVVQDDARATLAPKLSRQSAMIDWTFPAIEISRKIRGLYPWPGCRARLLDAAGCESAKFTLVRARVTEDEGPRWRPGEIMTAGAVACAEQAVEIVEIQPDGKRPMPLSDYRRGNPWMPGMRLESI
ncbi:MAG TPA: methionyl-tRNA formyltransferase [Tepidisphaeraceae bacterium]|jgi:methionyl-tRNA formyltransferase|nr:methionyl-tRNA formyltransferase [Tepidisphaeraceae bacterium]